MPENRKRSWKLLVISGDESNVRQLHIPRRAVVLLVGTIALLIMYAAVETVLFWIVARRAAEVEPLRKRVRELESSNSELARLGKDLEQLQAFERQLRRVLSGRESALSTTLPWQRSTFEPYGDEVGSVVELGAAKVPVLSGMHAVWEAPVRPWTCPRFRPCAAL